MSVLCVGCLVLVAVALVSPRERVVPSVVPPVPVPVYSSPFLGKKRSLTVDKLKIEGRWGKKINWIFMAFSALSTEGE